MITAFIGDNGHAREQAASEYIAGFVAVNGDTAVDRFAADSLEMAQLTDSLATVPFLSPRRLVVVRDLSTNKALADAIEDIAKNVADSSDLVIIENHIDNRSKYLSNLKNLAEVREFAHLEGEDLLNWIESFTESLGGKIDHSAALSLVDRVGTNHQLISNELQKLVLYSTQVTPDSIKLLTTYNPQSSVFNMLDSAFSGNAAQALRLYHEQRSQGMEPQALMGMIIWQLVILCIIKTAGNELPPNEIAAKAKISPFVIRKNLTNVRRLSEAKIINLLKLTIDTDIKLKTTSVNADSAVQTLIMAFA